jgi:hypothetical protein
VIPYSRALTIYLSLIAVLLAMGAGAFSGVLASFLLRLPIRGVWKDALLGSLGFLVGFVMVLVTPLGYFLVNHFIDPITPGLVLAVLFAVAREVLRFRRLRRPITGAGL